MIYHYCSIDSVIPIIESKCLWMSDISKMSDPSEYSLGFNLVIEEFYKLYPEHIDWLKYRHTRHSNRVLSTSFSRRGDVLSQWRAYSSDGTGVSIGFDENILLEINKYTKTDEVNYSQSVLKIEAAKEISAHNVGIESFQMKGLTTYDLGLADTLSELAIFYKSDFYKEEEEIRLVSSLSDYAVTHTRAGLRGARLGELFDDRKVFFRTSTYGLIPYINLFFCHLEKIAIKEVIIGPKSPLTMSDMTLLLEYNKLNDIIVKTSEGIYR